MGVGSAGSARRSGFLYATPGYHPLALAGLTRLLARWGDMDHEEFLEVAARLLEAVGRVRDGSPEQLLLLTRLSEVVGERLCRAARPTAPALAREFAGGVPKGEAEHQA